MKPQTTEDARLYPAGTPPMSRAHSIDISEDAGVRYLHFGSEWIQGAMRIARPWNLELAYTREMMACLLLRQEANWPKSALLIGLGAASLPKFIYRHLPQCRITVVEIQAGVVAAARQFFKLPQDEQRLEVVIADGADYIAQSTEQFDLIIVDGFDPDARAGSLDTAPFYTACRDRLSQQGLLACNLLGRNRGFLASAERIRKAFVDRAIVFPSLDSGNAIQFAAVGDPVSVSLEDMREYATVLKKDTGLDLLPTISRLQLTKALPGGKLVL
jgi:spermidine synthase